MLECSADDCRAKLVAPYTFSPGEETLQTTFFLPNEIPFDQVSLCLTCLLIQICLPIIPASTVADKSCLTCCDLSSVPDQPLSVL